MIFELSLFGTSMRLLGPYEGNHRRELTALADHLIWPVTYTKLILL